MKINDIINESIVDEETLDEWSQTNPGIKKELIKQGYKFLGKGVDQSAYLEPGTGLVLKIFGTQGETSGSGGSKLSPDQKMFLIWAKFCEKNSNNKFLPKFGGYERFVFNGHTYFQIRQERLSKINTKFGDMLEYYVDTAADGVRYSNTVNMNWFKEWAYEIDDNGDFTKEETYEFMSLKKFMSEKDIIELGKTAAALSKIADSKNFTFDLHGGNFMKRANGQLVIVDPWVVPESF